MSRRLDRIFASGADAKTMLQAAMRESEWDAWLVRWAEQGGWWHVHQYDSRHSTAGWPDHVFVRPPEIVFAEAKRVGEKLRADQELVATMLRACGQEVYAPWTPADWEAARERLLRAPVGPGEWMERFRQRLFSVPVFDLDTLGRVVHLPASSRQARNGRRNIARLIGSVDLTENGGGATQTDERAVGQLARQTSRIRSKGNP